MSGPETGDLSYHGVRLPGGGRRITLERPQRTAVGDTCGWDVLGELPEVTRHGAPGGLNWGYGGSGPADTARSLLLHALGPAARCATCAGTGHVIEDLDSTRPHDPDRDGAAAQNPAAYSCLACDGGWVPVRHQRFKWPRSWPGSPRTGLPTSTHPNRSPRRATSR